MHWWRRAPKREGVVCLELGPDGAALAHIVPGGSGRRRLAVCEYLPAQGDAELSRAVLGAVREHGLTGATCLAVLPPDSYSLRLLDAPEVEPGEIATAARWLISDFVEFDIDDAAVDYFEVPQQARDRTPRIYVVAAPAYAVRTVIEVAESSGLELAAIDITELALRNLGTLLSEDDRGLALVQLGRLSGRIVVTNGGSLYLARSLEAGLNRLLGLRGEPFEGGSAPVRADGEVLDTLSLELQRSLDYYEAQLGQPPLADLIVAPSEEPMPELVPQLADHLAVNVRRLDLNELFECDDELPESLQARCLSAVGAALRAEVGAP